MTRSASTSHMIAQAKYRRRGAGMFHWEEYQISRIADGNLQSTRLQRRRRVDYENKGWFLFFFSFTCFIEPYKVWRRMKTWNGAHIFFIFPPPPKCTNSIPYLEFHTLMPNVPRWQTQYKRGNKNRVVKEEKQHQTKADRKPNIQINQKNWFGG